MASGYSTNDPLNLTEEAITLNRRLARIQLFAPLSVLLFVVAAALSSLVAKPTLAQISEDYLTVLTPSTNLIGIYWGVLLLLLFGQCLLLALARKDVTKELLVNGIGTRTALVNVLMAAWVLFWTLKLFLVAEVILFVALALAVSVWGTLISYPPSTSRPIDFLFVHVPARMTVCILFTVDIWQNGSIVLGWYRYLGPAAIDALGKWEPDHTAHSWGAFGLVLGLALVNAAVVFSFTDIPWAVSTIYLFTALAYHKQGKPAQVFITLILGAALVFVAMVSAIGWTMIKKDREGAIRLEEEADEEDEEALVRPGGVA